MIIKRMHYTPKISIITVTLNAAADLQKTLGCLAGQDYPELEIIVIDGGSTDETRQVIALFSDRLSYWICEPDHGIYDAMNKGLAKATGEWVNFMNAGDVFISPLALSTVFTGDYHDTDVIYGDGIADYCNFKLLQKASPLDDLWKGMPFCHQAMFTRTALVKPQGFSTEYTIASDFDLVYRLYTGNRNFHHVPDPICIFEVRGVSNQLHIKSWKERYGIYKKYGNTSVKKQVFYGSLFIVFLFTWLGYAVFPRKMMYGIVKFIYREHLI